MMRRLRQVLRTNVREHHRRRRGRAAEAATRATTAAAVEEEARFQSSTMPSWSAKRSRPISTWWWWRHQRTQTKALPTMTSIMVESAKPEVASSIPQSTINPTMQPNNMDPTSLPPIPFKERNPFSSDISVLFLEEKNVIILTLMHDAVLLTNDDYAVWPHHVHTMSTPCPHHVLSFSHCPVWMNEEPKLTCGDLNRFNYFDSLCYSTTDNHWCVLTIQCLEPNEYFSWS